MIKQETEQLTLEIGEKIYTLQLLPFANEIELDDVLSVDTSNLLAEIMTFPVVMNKIAIMRNEMQHQLNEIQLKYNIQRAHLNEWASKELEKDLTKKDTEANRTDWVRRSPEYKALKYELLNAQREFGIIDAFYWSAKSKDTKLDKMAHGVVPSEHELEKLQGVINGVLIKGFKKAII